MPTVARQQPAQIKAENPSWTGYGPKTDYGFLHRLSTAMSLQQDQAFSAMPGMLRCSNAKPPNSNVANTMLPSKLFWKNGMAAI